MLDFVVATFLQVSREMINVDSNEGVLVPRCQIFDPRVEKVVRGGKGTPDRGTWHHRWNEGKVVLGTVGCKVFSGSNFGRAREVASLEIRWHAFLRPWHTRSIIDRNNIGIVPFPSRGTSVRGNRVD